MDIVEEEGGMSGSMIVRDEDWKKTVSKTHKMFKPTHAGNPGCAAGG